MQLLLHEQVARSAPVGKQCILKRAELLNVSAHCSHGNNEYEITLGTGSVRSS